MQPSAMQQQWRLGFVDPCTCANTNIEPFSNTLEKNCTLHLYVRKQRFAPLAALINGIGIVYIIHILCSHEDLQTEQIFQQIFVHMFICSSLSWIWIIVVMGL